jgi:hypothetical protein
MKKLLLLLCVIATALSAHLTANPSVPLTPPTEENNDGDPNRHKMPPAPVFCRFDFDNASLSFSSLSFLPIEEYQICDAENPDMCLQSFTSEAEFVTVLANSNGEFAIRFKTEKGFYTGYISL